VNLSGEQVHGQTNGLLLLGFRKMIFRTLSEQLPTHSIGQTVTGQFSNKSFSIFCPILSALLVFIDMMADHPISYTKRLIAIRMKDFLLSYEHIDLVSKNRHFSPKKN
jgi:hypothetical protein